MPLINSTQLAQYLDRAGDDPSKDWFVIRDDITDHEATLPVTSLPELIDAARGSIDDGDDLTIRGESLDGGPVQNVTIPCHNLNTLISVLLYFNEGATATVRPPLEVTVFDNADDLLASLGLSPGDRNG